jgi:hypothetical protein
MRFVCQTLCLVFLAIFLPACKTIQAPHPVSSESVVAYEPLISYVRLPVNIPLKSINELINTQMGSLVYEDRSYTQPSADDYQLIVIRRASVTSVFEGKDLKITIPLNIWGKAQWKACSFCPAVEKETRFDIDIYVRSTPELHSDYSFKLNLKSDGFEWKTRPVLALGPINIPIERLVQKPLEKQLEQTIKDVEREIASSFDLRVEIERMWKLASEPVLIDAGTQTWLSIRPEQVFVSSLGGANGNLNIVLGAAAFVGTVSGIKPANRQIKALPPLQIMQNVPSDFRVQVQSEVSFEALRDQLKTEMVGKSFSQGRKQIKVEDVAISASGNRLLVQVVFSGSAKGSIFLSGIPAYDEAEGELYFRELDLDVQSRSLLLKSAAWILNTPLQGVLSKQLRYQAGNSLNAVKEELTQKIKSFGSKGVYQVNGAVNTFSLQGIFVKPEGLLIVLDAKGRVDLKIEKLSF